MKKRTPLILALLTLLTLALTGAALAAPVPDSGGGLLNAFLEGITPVLLDVLLGVGVLGLGLLARFTARLIGQVQNDTFRKALENVDRLAQAKVLELYQDAISDLKDASEDGRLTIEEAHAAAATALHELTDTLPRWLIATLTDSARNTLAEVQDKYLLPAIEKAVTGSHVITAAKSVVDTTADPARLQERLAAARARIGMVD